MKITNEVGSEMLRKDGNIRSGVSQQVRNGHPAPFDDRKAIEGEERTSNCAKQSTRAGLVLKPFG